jgi:hypothetical protein
MAPRCNLTDAIAALEDAHTAVNRRKGHWTPADRDAHRAIRDALIALYQVDEAYDREVADEQLFGA